MALNSDTSQTGTESRLRLHRSELSSASFIRNSVPPSASHSLHDMACATLLNLSSADGMRATRETGLTPSKDRNR